MAQPNPNNFETAKRASGKAVIALGELTVNLEVWKGAKDRDDDEYRANVKPVCQACMGLCQEGSVGDHRGLLSPAISNGSGRTQES